MKMRTLSTIAIFSLFLTACASKPASYLPTNSEPIINIESDITDKIQIKANAKKWSVANLTDSPLKVTYTLFWYNHEGVTQLFNGISENLGWQILGIAPKQNHTILLSPPTEESTQYRLYIRGIR